MCIHTYMCIYIYIYIYIYMLYGITGYIYLCVPLIFLYSEIPSQDLGPGADSLGCPRDFDGFT